MDQNNAEQMISRTAVEEMLRQQADVFQGMLRQQAEVFETKLQAIHFKHLEVRHQLEMSRIDSDTIQRKLLRFEKALVDLEANTDRTRDMNQTLRELASAFNEKKHDHEAAIQALRSSVANDGLELARLSHVLASGQGAAALPIVDIRYQHDRMRAIIEEQEKQLARTNSRHVTEGSMACNCAHKKINERIDRTRHRISDVEKRLRKSLIRLPAAARSARARAGCNGAGDGLEDEHKGVDEAEENGA